SYHTGATALGPAFVEAVCEEKATRFPRIGICRSALNHTSESDRRYITSDQHGNWFDTMKFFELHYDMLFPAAGMDPIESKRSITRKMLTPARAALVTMMNNRDLPEAPREKVRWAIRRFNQSVIEHGPLNGLLEPISGA